MGGYRAGHGGQRGRRIGHRSASEDPGWVAKVCGTSERLIFEHNRKFISNLRRLGGRRIAGL